jgi:hypothetical protein
VATPAQSYVQLASDDTTGTPARRRVLGARKDPFEPAPLPKVKKKKAAKASATATATATATAPVEATATSTPASGGGTVTAPAAPTATPAPKPHVVGNSVNVRFGPVSGTLAKSNLTRLKTLPSASSPLVVFMGFAKGGKVAVFMLTGTVAAEGDGTCDPAPQDCQTLELRKGQTEFLTFTGTAHDGQYELDLNELHATESGSGSATALVAKATPTATVTATATATP